MVNTEGVLAVLDHHITINWDDGPTLHRIAAQVRYHTAESAAVKTLRVNASHRYSDEPLSFMVIGDGLRASWVWQERGSGWTAQLAVTSEGEDDLYLDALDIIRIDYAFSGLFNLGAPPGLWRCAIEAAGAATASVSQTDVKREIDLETPVTSNTETALIVPDAVIWETWPTASGSFIRNRELLIQPSLSNRSRPPAILFRVVDPAAESALLTEFQLELSGERFERMVGRCRTDGMLLGAGVTFASPEIWVVAGDDAAELRQLSVEV
jgi:hypothetical protein